MNNNKRDFDSEAASWDDKPPRLKLAQDVAEAIMSEVALTPDMNVLDFGCGTGLLTLRLQPKVKSIVGVDSSPGMLAVFEEKISKLKLANVRAEFVDIECDGALRGTYGMVVTSMTLHHIRDVETLLAHFYEILEPAGILCIADLDSEGGEFHDSADGVFHFGFDRTALRDTLARAGFDTIRDRTAALVMKPRPSGQPFPVFLMTARKQP